MSSRKVLCTTLQYLHTLYEMTTKEDTQSDFEERNSKARENKNFGKNLWKGLKEFKFMGLVLLLSSSVTGALMSVFVKQITEVNPIFMVVVRSGVIGVTISFYLLLKKKWPIGDGKKDLALLSLRGSTFFIYGAARNFAFR